MLAGPSEKEKAKVVGVAQSEANGDIPKKANNKAKKLVGATNFCC